MMTGGNIAAEFHAAAIDRLLARDPEAMAKGCARARDEKVGTMADHFTGLFALYERLKRERPAR